MIKSAERSVTVLEPKKGDLKQHFVALPGLARSPCRMFKFLETTGIKIELRQAAHISQRADRIKRECPGREKQAEYDLRDVNPQDLPPSMPKRFGYQYSHN
jgi:hypothetical protein